MKKDTSEMNKKDEYIKKLENEINLLTKRRTFTPEEEELDVIVKRQKELLNDIYKEKDSHEKENLLKDNARLIRTIELNHLYIGYLSQSIWWKMTFPIRFLYRKFFNKSINYNFICDVSDKNNIHPIEDKVSVIIFTYNAGEKINQQLEYLQRQKYVNNLDIIVVDKGSKDNTIDFVSSFGVNIINIKDINLTDSEIYEMLLPKIRSKYVVLMEQNKIIKSDYWIYQSLVPIIDDMAVATVFFNENINSFVDSSCYKEMKSRMTKLAGEKVFFFPKNRDAIQYFNPIILEKSSVIVKKKISNMFLI